MSAEITVAIPTMYRDRVGYAHIYGALYCCSQQTKQPAEILILADKEFPFSAGHLTRRVREIFDVDCNPAAIRIHLLDGHSISDKRNHALSKSLNEWVAFMDDDDWYGSDYLAEIQAYLFAYGMPAITARLGCHGYRFTRWGGGRYGVFSFVHGPAQVFNVPFMQAMNLKFIGTERAEDARLHSQIQRLQLGFKYGYYCQITGSKQMLHILYPDTPDQYFTRRDWWKHELSEFVGAKFASYLRHLKRYST